MQVPCQQKFWFARRANISFTHFGDQGCAPGRERFLNTASGRWITISFRSMTGIVALSVSGQRGRTGGMDASSFKRNLKGKDAR
jgi:hypothetical protein